MQTITLIYISFFVTTYDIICLLSLLLLHRQSKMCVSNLKEVILDLHYQDTKAYAITYLGEEKEVDG